MQNSRENILAPLLKSFLEDKGIEDVVIKIAESLMNADLTISKNDLLKVAEISRIEVGEILTFHENLVSKRFSEKMKGVLTSFLMNNSGHFSFVIEGDVGEEVKALSLKPNDEGLLIPYSAANATELDRCLDAIIDRAFELKSRLREQFKKSKTNRFFLEQDECLAFHLYKKSRMSKKIKKKRLIEFGGEKYGSVTELAKELNVSDGFIHSRIKRSGLFKKYNENSLTQRDWENILKPENGKTEYIYCKGEKYESFSDLALSVGLTYGALYQRLKYRGLFDLAMENKLTDEQWDYIISNKKSRIDSICININGTNYTSISSLSATFGISTSTLHHRINTLKIKEKIKDGSVSEMDLKKLLKPVKKYETSVTVIKQVNTRVV